MPADPPDLSPLLTPQGDFSVLVKSARESKDTDAPRVDLLHLRFKENKADLEGLAEAVYHQIVNYALPKRKLAELQARVVPGGLDFSQHSKILAEARRAFIAYNSKNTDPQANTRYAEVGEVIAFCVASHYLTAGQVAAKMALKTNSQMPIYGLDGVHARVEQDGTLTVFFLESKMVGDAKSGAGQYAKSAGGFDADRGHKLNEQRIARDLSNLDLLEAAAKEKAVKYFDPYSEEQSDVRERFVGVIIHTDSQYANSLPVTDATPLDAHERNFVDLYVATYDSLQEALSDALKSKKAELGRCRAFFLAVPDVNKLKELFAKEMSGGHIR